MQQLSATYAWARDLEISDLRRAVMNSEGYPLVAIGSGGSFTAAALAARLHFQQFGRFSAAITPLESADLRVGTDRAAVWLFSARGRNTDVLNAYQNAMLAETAEIIAFCMSSVSPLATLMAERSGTYLGFDLPNGKDGFLATNSLLATALLLLRVYGVGIPNELFAFLNGANLIEQVHEHVGRFATLWSCDYLLVLHGTETAVGVIDLESKFSEAALGSINASNFRDFAHGRHHWLSRFSKRTGVLCIETERDHELAAATMALLPPQIPRQVVSISQNGMQAQFASLVWSFVLAGAAGIARGIDPGRPGVAQFGSSLYHLKSPQAKRQGRKRVTVQTAMARKIGLAQHDLSQESLERWIEYHASFVDKLRSTRFGGIVFDVDGTLLRRQDRLGLLSDVIIAALRRVLEGGLMVGIATGRGDGIFPILEQAVPSELRSQVLIGAYNGSLMRWLDDTDPICHTMLQNDGIEQAKEILQSVTFPTDVELRLRPMQLTLRPRTIGTPPQASVLWSLAEEAIVLAKLPGVKVVRSTHSIDVLPLGVSKSQVVKEIRKRISGEVLAIGDMGAWPGNDFEMLAGSYGISVDEVSRRPDSCWNLLPAGSRNVDGTVHYLSQMRFSQHSARFISGAFG